MLQDETLHDAALSPSGKMQALDALAEIKRLTMQLVSRSSCSFSETFLVAGI